MAVPLEVSESQETIWDFDVSTLILIRSGNKIK